MTVQEAHADNPKTALVASPLEAGDQTGETSLLDVLVQLAIHKKLIAKVTGVVLLIGLVVSVVWPVKYAATTTLMPPQQSPSATTLMLGQLSVMTGASSSLAAMAGSGLGLKSPNDIYIGMLESRPIADAIIEKFDLTRVYHSRDMTGARKKLESNTDIVSEKSGLISIVVTDRDKTRSAEIANAYTDQLRLLTKNVGTTEASRRVLFYEDQLNQSKDSLVTAESNLETVEQKKGLVQLDAQAKAMIESLTLLRAQVTTKQVEVQAMRLSATENNPQLQLAEQELAALQTEVAHLEQSNHSTEFSNLGMQDVPGAGLDYLRALREVQYQQTLYGILLKQFDAAKLDEAKDATVIQVVEPAVVPDRKASPKRGIILLVSAFLGLFIGCALAMLSWWKTRMESNPHSARQLDELRYALSRQKKHSIL